MKKVLIAAVALMVGASLSLAGLGINWANGGWMAEYGADPSSDDGPWVLDNNNVIWQLIYAGADNVANEPDLRRPTISVAMTRCSPTVKSLRVEGLPLMVRLGTTT